MGAPHGNVSVRGIFFIDGRLLSTPTKLSWLLRRHISLTVHVLTWRVRRQDAAKHTGFRTEASPGEDHWEVRELRPRNPNSLEPLPSPMFCGLSDSGVGRHPRNRLRGPHSHVSGYTESSEPVWCGLKAVGSCLFCAEVTLLEGGEELLEQLLECGGLLLLEVDAAA